MVSMSAPNLAGADADAHEHQAQSAKDERSRYCRLFTTDLLGRTYLLAV